MLDGIGRFAKTLQGLALFNPDGKETLSWQLERLAAKRPQQPFLLFEDRRFSYGEANALINRHARAYQGLGLGKGDTVALMMGNRPEFLWHFFGLGKIGARAALINTHLSGEPLVHALRTCQPKRIVVGSDVWDGFSPVSETVFDVAPIDVHTDDAYPVGTGMPRWESRLETSDRDPEESAQQRLEDVCAYVYTSGTTGLPKAALMKHSRFYRAGRIFGGAAWRLRPGDVLYDCLPLYHANSIALATAAVVSYGVTLALARRFSARAFWEDVRRFDATCFVYIGELCRYLMNAEPSPDDRRHRIRAISGNGLRPEIWEAFQNRFGIDRIAEFYGSTEGNVLTINLNDVVGSVGKLVWPATLVRWNEELDSFDRDAKGRLIRCRAGEPVILLGKIGGNTAFEGYRDRDATEKKVIRDAFRKGDAWFDSGDLLRRDARYNLYFVDRLGDTFRWKGENVSTVEVQEQIAKWPAASEVSVYGVRMGSADGRAGMASLVLRPQASFDASSFKRHVDATLPKYARPLLVRIVAVMETTSTFKPKKAALQRQGFDPRTIADALYLRHPERDEYVLLDAASYDAVMAGRLRL